MCLFKNLVSFFNKLAWVLYKNVFFYYLEQYNEYTPHTHSRKEVHPRFINILLSQQYITIG